MNKIKYTLLVIIFVSLSLFHSCEDSEVIETQNIDYVGFVKSFSKGVDVAIVTEIDVDVYTTQVSDTDRTFAISLNSDLTTLGTTAFTIPTNVTIPANSNKGTFTVSINGPDIDGGGDLVLALGDGASDFTGEDLTIAVFPVCFDNTANLTLTLDITFDSWPEEIYWRIQNSSGETIAESASPPAFGAYAGLTGSVSQDFCLTDGSYTFTIFDGVGDGAGAYTLTFNDGTEIHSSDGSYGAGETIAFEL
jgi:hypothetical protein